MSNKVYGLILYAQAHADYDVDTADIRAVAVSSSYPWSDSHQFKSSLTNLVSDVVAVTTEVATSITGGYMLDCDDFTLTTVTGTAAAIVFLDFNGGADSARRLIAFMDTGVTGLPVTLSGGTLPTTVNASGILRVTSS